MRKGAKRRVPISRMAFPVLLQRRNMLQKKTGRLAGDFFSSDRNTARLAKLNQEIGRRVATSRQLDTNISQNRGVNRTLLPNSRPRKSSSNWAERERIKL